MKFEGSGMVPRYGGLRGVNLEKQDSVGLLSSGGKKVKD